MATGWNAQMTSNNYRIQFETTHKDLYKMVEKACQIAMDEEGKRKSKSTAVYCSNCDRYLGMIGRKDWAVCTVGNHYCNICGSKNEVKDDQDD